MKTSFIIAQAFATLNIAAPTGVDYSKIDYTNVDYSKVDFSKLDYSKVDYSKVDFSKVPYQQQPSHPVQPRQGDLLPFTSRFHIVATPDQVVNASNVATGGLEGAIGYYDYGINSELDIICYYIQLKNFRGEYQSPARTATHIHQGDKGKNGPPRIAFPNPQVVPGKEFRISAGCLSGPFRTGLNGTNGQDTGIGFRVAQIEQNPGDFFTDVHSSLAVPGAVRGQFV